MEARDTSNQHLNASDRQIQALTTNIQELTRQSAADRRQMQELIRQNQELIALLRSRGEVQIPNLGQNNGEDPCNEEGANQNLDQNDERSSANQNRQLRPNQVAEPTRSAADAKDAKLEEELKEMKEQMKEMKSQVKVKAARNLNMLVHHSELPFTKRVDDYPLLAKFKVPKLENFDGLKDLLDYLDSFRTVMQLQGVSDEIMCRAFPTNLKAFNVGLRKGDFLFQLCKDPPKSMSKLMYEAQKFINAKDTFEALDKFPSRKRKEPEDRRFKSSKSKMSKPDNSKVDWKNAESSSGQGGRPKNFTPLNMSIDQVLLQIQDDPTLKWPEKLRSTPERRNNQETRPPNQEENKNHLEDRPRDVIGEIRTIVGALASEGTSRLSRKAYARQAHNILVTQRPQKNVKLDDQVITFSEDDAREIHQPQDDTQVVTMTIAGFITRRVLINNGSSADIIYLPEYQQMKIDKERLRLIDIPLVGFTRDKFLVVNCSSVYNVIIGRPTFNKLRTVTSTYHLLVRFPTEHGIGELKGDQAAARECYFTSLGPETKQQTMAIGEGQKLVEPTEKLKVIVLDDEQPNKTTYIGTKMDGRVKKSLRRIPKRQHRHLGLDTRRYAWNQTISDEVEKLLTAGFIREVSYPDWLVNVVIVKKSNSKWRMCVDFTDLNKACPKDSFPLPRIDQLLDSTARHKLLTFMDAFSSYNQIVMNEDD
uniref:Reverse transcriptase domain-containing protein n=1 Tax=Fagus sylvatica TaxID=28930 RepID=A0A2N9IZJ8_FAGSY